MKRPPVEITGQFITHRKNAAGGLRVSIDIPQSLEKDIATASLLSTREVWCKINIEVLSDNKNPTKQPQQPNQKANNKRKKVSGRVFSDFQCY